MRIWRLLVELGPEVWTFVVVAPDHVRAWQVLLEDLDDRRRELAFLEELEATSATQADLGPSRVLRTWRSAPLEEPHRASGRSPTAA